MSFCIKVLFLLITQQFTTSRAKYRIGVGIDPCLELERTWDNLEQALECCDTMKKVLEPIFSFEDCFDIEPEIWSCRKLRCFLESGPGILIEKKDIDPAKGLKMLEDNTKKYPELEQMNKKLGHECFDKNLTQFYNYDHKCPSVNLMYCIAMHAFGDCPLWKGSESCKIIATGSQLCKPRMDEYDKITERLYNAVPSTTTELTTVTDDYDTSLKSCGSLTVNYRNLELAKECCPAMKTIFEPIDETEDCLVIKPKEWSCKKFKCLLKTGPKLLTRDGAIDVKQGRQMLETIANANPRLTNLTETIDHECFVKNLTRFYHIEDCPATNLIYCFASNLLADCPHWNVDQKCKPLARPARNCRAFLSFYRKITDLIQSGIYTSTTPTPKVPTKEPTFESCESINKDYNLLQHTKKCCDGMTKILGLIEMNQDCEGLAPGEWSCKKSRCYLDVPQDLLINKRQVNLTKARSILHEFMEEDQETEHMARVIEHECVDKNVSLYYPVEKFCPALSFHNCWALNSFAECPSWNQGPECKPMRVWGKKCHITMEQIRHKTDIIENGIIASEATVIYPDKVTSPMPSTVLCSELISDYTYVSAAEYCCYPMKNIFMDILHIDKKCTNVSPARWSCKKCRCLLSEIPDLLIDDWYINRERGKDLLREIASKYPKTEEITKMLYKECIEKNVTRFYPIEDCPAINLMYCFLVNSFSECKYWSAEKSCDKIVRSAKKCKRALDKVRVVTDEIHAESIRDVDNEIEQTTGYSTKATDDENSSVTGPDGRITGTGVTITDEDSVTDKGKGSTSTDEGSVTDEGKGSTSIDEGSVTDKGKDSTSTDEDSVTDKGKGSTSTDEGSVTEKGGGSTNTDEDSVTDKGKGSTSTDEGSVTEKGRGSTSTDEGSVTEKGRGSTITGEGSVTEKGKGSTSTDTVTSPYVTTPVDFTKPKCADLHTEYANVELAKYCCDAMEKVLQPLSENEGCLIISPHQWSCDKIQCLMSAVKGLLVRRNINPEVGHQMLENIAQKNPELAPMIKIMDHECFVKNVTRFYPMSSCPANSLMYCLVVNSFAECPVWSQGAGCKEVIESAKNCKRTLAVVRQASDVIHESEKSLTTPTITTEIETTTERKPKESAASSCGKLLLSYETLELAKQCCSLMKKVFEPLDQLEFCFDIEPEKWTCGKFRCFMSGVPNLLINYREVNPEVGRTMLREVAEKYPEVEKVTKLLEHECFVKNVSANYPVDKCTAFQYMYCLATNSFSECTTWSDRAECKPLEELAIKCKKYMDEDRAITDQIYEKQLTTTVKEKPTTRQTTALPPESLLCTDLGSDYEKLTVGVQCCKALDVLFEPLFASEVCDLMPEEWSCMKARCYLYAIPNMLLKNKSVNKTAAHEILRQIAEKHPDMAHMIKIIDSECFEKDANKFYKVNPKCPQQNIVYCMVVNGFAECPSWSDNPDCQPLKESSLECKKVIDDIKSGSTTNTPGHLTFNTKELDHRSTNMPKITTGTTQKPTRNPLCPDITSEFQNLCEKAQCLLEAAGLLVDSRFVNEAAGKELLRNLAQKHSEMASMNSMIKKECFVKNASRFYPFNNKCPPQNVLFCIMVNSFSECPSWNDHADCQPVKESSQKCKKIMEPIRKKTDDIHHGKKTTTTKITTRPTKDTDIALCPEISTKFDHFKQSLDCCKSMWYIFEPFSNDVCDKLAPRTWTCEKARCFLSKAQMLIQSQYVDEAAGRELMEKIAKEHPETAPTIKIIEHECFTKNSSRFYPLDNKCPPHNLLYCMIVNSFSECPSWSDEPACEELVNLSKKCKRRLDKIRKQTDKIYGAHTTTTTTTTTAAPVTPVDFTKPQCSELRASYDAFDQAKNCCMTIEKIFDEIISNRNICLLLDQKKIWACAKFECLFTNANLLKRVAGHSDYIINYEAGHELLRTISQKYPEVAPVTQVMDKECFVKNVTHFYPINNCVSSSLMYCLAVNAYADCPKWTDSTKCHPVIENAKRCKKSLDNARNESDFIHRELEIAKGITTPLTTTEKTKIETDDDYLNCLEFMNPDNMDLAKECCAPFNKVMDLFDENNYCLDMSPDTWYSRPKLQCLLTAIPDFVDEKQFTINVTVGKQAFTKQIAKYPEFELMIKHMIHECFEKNFSKFYYVDKCDLFNNFHCLVANGFAECPSWNEAKKCKSVTEMSRLCQKSLVGYRNLTDELSNMTLDLTPDPTEACGIVHRSIKDLEQSKHCCDAIKKVFEPTENKACDVIEPLDQWSCKRMKCLLSTYPGLVTTEKGIDGNVGKEMLDKISKQHPSLESLVTVLKEECFKEKMLVKTEKTCPAFKFTYCLALNSFAECPSWKDSAECKPYAEKANECKTGLGVTRQKEQKLYLRKNGGAALTMQQSCVAVIVTCFAITI